jgi:signal-transduction protein with cAMP-binding, CBS, and nucleotidyltransferase domain
MLEAAHTMTQRKVRRLPVVEGSDLVRLVSLSDIALAIDSALDSMQEALHDLLLGMGASRST